jgi:hypothetical protein
VQLSSRSDEELVTLARRGWPAAFAVLLHRHGATVRAAVADSSNPDAAVVRTFTRAMRQLPRADTAAPVAPWLLALAPGRGDRTAPSEPPPPALDDPQVDALWAELAPRWPEGRVPRRLPTWLRYSLLTLVLTGLAVVIPYATITTGQRTATSPDTDAELLRAALLEPEDATDDDLAGGEESNGTEETTGAAEERTDGTEDETNTTEDQTVAPAPAPDTPDPGGTGVGEDGP